MNQTQKLKQELKTLSSEDEDKLKTFLDDIREQNILNIEEIENINQKDLKNNIDELLLKILEKQEKIYITLINKVKKNNSLIMKKIVNQTKEDTDKLLEISLYFANNKDIKYQLNNIKLEIESNKKNSAIYFQTKGEEFMLEAETQQNNQDYLTSNLKYDRAKYNFAKSIDQFNDIKGQINLIVHQILIPKTNLPEIEIKNSSEYITLDENNNTINNDFKYWKPTLIVFMITNCLIIIHFAYKLIIYKMYKITKPNLNMNKFQV
ncbi:MAG: hypothetical protein Q8839_01425 [Candidatus Phytoplasma australasiaticum]|nr:hypothetical protein [Candidatus Phytoplasma australasiaticum]MDV3153749.1 hypothetical protein [Candidatus Phytoplasma australasiaticum]MDV3167594.1 hypothetical protein [Candidatus Phytoplasma australasiaticum]MDV3180988.1 hypothetical protein [Candidatus Phytoplasma australasiaticum]MDV3183254.1 hypothetical protein [Candidatus Phytoplasma australasiaticum]